MRRWKFWIGLAISLVFLSIALYGLDFQHFWQILREAHYWWLLPGIGVYFLTVWARAWRWRAMLAHVQPIPTRRLFPVVVIGYMGNNVYPLRAGEVLRSYVLRRNEGVPMSASLATVVLERMFDGLVMLLFIFVTLPFAPLPPIFRTLVIGLGLLFGLALIVFILLAARPARIARLYAVLVDRLMPPRLRPKVHGMFDRFISGLQSLRNPREMLAILLVTILIWLGETVKYWFVMLAFPFTMPFTVLMLLAAVVNLLTTIPSTPGYIGAFDAPGIAVLTGFGVPHALAAGYILVLHVALWLPITLLGAYFMVRSSLSWRDFDRAAALAAAGAATPTPPPVERDELVQRVIS